MLTEVKRRKIEIEEETINSKCILSISNFFIDSIYFLPIIANSQASKVTINSLTKIDNYFVDKSLFIIEWFDTPNDAILITRPRRFGKSTNLKLIADFFDINSGNIPKDSPFFKLKIFQDKKYVKPHFAKYQLIMLQILIYSTKSNNSNESKF